MTRVKQDKEERTTFGITKELIERLQAIGNELGRSANSVGTEFMESMLELAETPPNERMTPKILDQLDVSRGPRRPLSSGGADAKSVEIVRGEKRSR